MNCATHLTLLDYKLSSIRGLMRGYILHCQEIKYIYLPSHVAAHSCMEYVQELQYIQQLQYKYTNISQINGHELKYA